MFTLGTGVFSRVDVDNVWLSTLCARPGWIIPCSIVLTEWSSFNTFIMKKGEKKCGGAEACQLESG